MQIKFGLISSDSHVGLDRNAFTDRMSREKWDDKVPHLVEVELKSGEKADRWMVYGRQPRGEFRGFNCPAALDDNPLRNIYPKRWADVPTRAYDPYERLEALDSDGVDAEVLFPNDLPSFFQYGDAEYELACTQAYNDALADWRAVSDRYIPLAQVPVLCDVEDAVVEVQRAAARGCRGVVMLPEPSAIVPGLKHVSDPCWNPLWAACQDTQMPIHIHASGGLGQSGMSVPRWSAHAQGPSHAAYTTTMSAMSSQILPNLIFSGVLERYPGMTWVFAEQGIGNVNYAVEACDHEWERRRLWQKGLPTKPSDIVHRQVYVNFWYERGGMQLRHRIGVDNIMWESDYPHIVSTYPESWKEVERCVDGVPALERQKMLYENAMRLYRLA